MKFYSKKNYLKESSPKIEAQVKKLLLAADVGEKLPTPVDDIIECSKLIQIGKIDLDQFKDSWSKKGFSILKSAWRKIWGLVDIREQVVYISPDTPNSKKTFVSFHEVIHRNLPWQKDIYNPHYDTEYSINKELCDYFDTEANLGASLIQFQLDRFNNDMGNLALGLGSAISLAERYETSKHSTIHKYAEDNRRICALLILKRVNAEGFTELHYPIQSTKFTQKYGYIDWQKIYCHGDPIYDTIMAISSEEVNKGSMSALELTRQNDEWIIETFDNSFNFFVLLYPKPKLHIRKAPIIRIGE